MGLLDGCCVGLKVRVSPAASGAAVVGDTEGAGDG